ncbi:hypothetical protein ACSBR2_007141 [Camellia fascicularis]
MVNTSVGVPNIFPYIYKDNHVYGTKKKKKNTKKRKRKERRKRKNNVPIECNVLLMWQSCCDGDILDKLEPGKMILMLRRIWAQWGRMWIFPVV